MIRALAIVLLLAGFVHAPAGWREDAEQASAIAAKSNTLSHFGGMPSVVTVQVFVPPSGVGALFVTAVAAKVTEHREAAARAEIDSFMAGVNRAQLESSKARIGKQFMNVQPMQKHLEAGLEWTDDAAGIATHTRILVVADTTNLVAVSGECVLGAATSQQERDGCDKALESLDPEIAVDKRVVLELAPEGSEPPPPPGSARPAPSMSDGSRAPVPPITLPSQPQQTVDRRPVYVGLGIVVLAGLFWWNRRRRERFDAKDTDARTRR